MKRCALLFGLLSVVAIPSAAQALGHVIIGNQPLTGYGTELLAVVNVEERVYAYIHDFSYTFYFKGGPKALNDAMRRFAAVPAHGREIRILPVPSKPLMHEQPVAYDWCLYVPGTRDGMVGRERGVGEPEFADTRAVLTVLIPTPLPGPLADPKAARKWIADLGSDDFKIRERAAIELKALGSPVAVLLREALRGKPSAEARDRLERLLAGVSTEIRVDVLQLPAGVPVLSLDGLLARARKGLASEHSSTRGDAIWDLTSHGAPAEEVLPDIEKMFKNETLAGPLAAAARATYHLGAAARPLLPALQDLAKSTDKDVVIYAKQAIVWMEKAKAEPPVSEADAKKRAVIRKEINDFVVGRKE